MIFEISTFFWRGRIRAEGQTGRLTKKGSVYPGSARASLHPRLLSCHHSVVRHRGCGRGSRIFEISTFFWRGRIRAEGETGRLTKRGSVYPGSARASLHPQLLSCHHSVVRHRGCGRGSMTFEISTFFWRGFCLLPPSCLLAADYRLLKKAYKSANCSGVASLSKPSGMIERVAGPRLTMSFTMTVTFGAMARMVWAGESYTAEPT